MHTYLCIDDSFKLTSSGYDYLALRALTSRGSIASIGNQIGVGKESDILVVQNAEGKVFVSKFHRLGRASFRTVKNNRDYLRGRHASSWLYLSRLSATKEYAYLRVLHDHGFPVPEPIDHSRHVVVMELLNATTLCHITELRADPGKVYAELMGLLIRLAEHGLIHGDFNEFNIMLDNETERAIVIDFPQMVSTSHKNAEMYFDRDVQGLKSFFRRTFRWESGDPDPVLSDIISTINLDWEVEASGFIKAKGDDGIDPDVFTMYKDMLLPTPLDGDEDDDDEKELEDEQQQDDEDEKEQENDDEDEQQENDDEDDEERNAPDRDDQCDVLNDDKQQKEAGAVPKMFGDDDDESSDNDHSSDDDEQQPQENEAQTSAPSKPRPSRSEVERRARVQLQRLKSKEKNAKMVHKSAKREKRSKRNSEKSSIKDM